MKSDTFGYLFFDWYWTDIFFYFWILWQPYIQPWFCIKKKKIAPICVDILNLFRDTCRFPEQCYAEGKADWAIVVCRWLNTQSSSSAINGISLPGVLVSLFFFGPPSASSTPPPQLPVPPLRRGMAEGTQEAENKTKREKKVKGFSLSFWPCVSPTCWLVCRYDSSATKSIMFGWVKIEWFASRLKMPEPEVRWKKVICQVSMLAIRKRFCRTLHWCNCESFSL